MLTFREGWRSFKEGLDKRFIWEYWLAVKNHAWEIFWGAGVIGIICTLYTLYYSPPWTKLGWVVAWVFLIAGYFAWRADHIRLIPKLAVRETRFQETPITYNGQIIGHRTFAQLVPACLTESPVYECVAYLQRVEKLTADGWKDTGLDRNLILNWAREHHPQAEQLLNVFFVSHNTNQIIPCLTEKADIPWVKFDSIFGGEPDIAEFRFYIQITYSDKANGNSLKPVRVCLDVNFANDRIHPALDLKESDA
jgi:hypothetical protein